MFEHNWHFDKWIQWSWIFHLVPFHFDADMARNSVKKNGRGRWIKQKNGDSFIAKKRNLVFFNTWLEQYRSNIVFDFFFLFHDANKDSQGGYVII